MDAQTHYSVLHVAEDAPQEVIRASYKLLIQKFHPDRVPDDEKSSAGETSKRLNGAYQVLSDPELRAEYDAMLRRVREEPQSTRGENQAPPPPPPPPQPRRTAKKPPAPTASHRPWARYWARTFDLVCALPLLAIGVAIILPAMDEAGYTTDSGMFALLFVALPISIACIEALALSTFGTTPGKKLLGIRVTLEDGNLLSAATAFKRSLGVQLKGLAWNLPFASVLSAAYWYHHLKSTGTTSWDRGARAIVSHQPVGFFRYTAAVSFCLLTLSAIALVDENASIFDPQTSGNSDVAVQEGQPSEKRSLPGPPATSIPQATTVADTYLRLSARQLNDEQFSSGANRWLEQYPEHANKKDLEILQGHLSSVLGQYPQIELRAALDMALKRAYLAGEQQANTSSASEQAASAYRRRTGSVRLPNEPLPRSLDYSAYAPTESVQPADPYVPIQQPTTDGPGLGPRSWEEMKPSTGSNSGR